MTLGIFAIISTVVLAHFLALISPGPDFLLIVKSAVKNRKSQAFGVAFGIANANAIYIFLCIIGVASVLAKSLWLMSVLKIVGALFLLYIAYHALRSKREDYAFIAQSDADNDSGKGSSFWREFITGFVSGISNPKNILFYLSLFSVVLTNDVALGFKIGLGVWMTFAVFMWNAFIILILSQKNIKALFAKIAFYIDKAAGLILGVMGIKLLESAIFDTRKA
ncbi:MAG: LysE family transporter [Pelistega sp.]|nr:LysE family transporter [Pelistega sp.]